jgi:hypothetical protein
MKAISIRQPWAWLILNAGKDIENRRWPTRLRGRVLIHAAKGMTEEEYDDASGFVEFNVDERMVLPDMKTLERGGIVGEVEIVDCVTASGSPWFCGPFGFVLRNPRPLPFRPCRGALGFFDAPEFSPAGHAGDGELDLR